MNAPKNYTVRNLKKSDEAEVLAVLKANPNWKLKHARELVARRNFQRAIETAGLEDECEHQYAEVGLAPLGVRCIKCSHFVGAWET